LRRHLICAVVIVGLALAFAAGCRTQQRTAPAGGGEGRPAEAVTLEIYVPCGVSNPIYELREAYEAENPNVKIKSQVETMGKLLEAVLSQGARPEVVLVLGDREQKVLEDAGLVAENGVVPVAGNYVGLVAPRGNPGGIKTLEDLAKPSAGSIALPNPDSNSSGYHFRVALTRAGLWDKVQDRLVIMKTTAEVQPALANKTVNIGAIYGPCFVEDMAGGGRPEPGMAKGKVEYVMTLAPEQTGAFAVAAVLIKGAPHTEQARKFAEFMAAPKQAAVWQKWAFDPAPRKP